MTVRLVTGHVRLPSADFYRSPDDFARYSKRLLSAPVEKSVFAEWPLENCWLYPHTHHAYPEPTVPLSAHGNPAKDTLDYMVVLAQKTEWLSLAYENDPHADSYVWADYGVFHQTGVTEEIIAEFLTRIKPDDMAFPGLWDKAPVPENEPCWRFLGSMFVCPRQFVHVLNGAVKQEILTHMAETGHVLWDVNNWARVELKDVLPIRWYRAAHDKSMFENYK